MIIFENKELTDKTKQAFSNYLLIDNSIYINSRKRILLQSSVLKTFLKISS